jgi:hypothetical protein
LHHGYGNPSCFSRVIIDPDRGDGQAALSDRNGAADGRALAADHRRPFHPSFVSASSSAAWSTGNRGL